MKDVESRIVSREVVVDLTADEMAAKRSAREHLRTRLESLNDKRKEVKTDLAAIEEAIITGTELRNMTCREELDYRLGEKRVIREDIDKVVERVALTAEERQVKIEDAAPEVKTTGRRKKLGRPKKNAGAANDEGSDET
jgi:hypothetical protein